MVEGMSKNAGGVSSERLALREELRREVAGLCRRFPDEYWRQLDR